MTNNSNTSLNPLRFPLKGSHLIEASAGTGKTFTIALLYVRLVLGHGQQNGRANAFSDGRRLTPPEILVVTFTDAATKELRERIRGRLAEAASYFRKNPAEITAPTEPDLLHELRTEYAPEQWPACARQLELAAEWMDEAAVSTIHGWCNRMLREHAFDSQSLFTQKLETDQSELLAEVGRDYWRIHYTPLGKAEIALATRYWQTPAELEKAAKPLLEHTAQLAASPAPAALLAHSLAEKSATLARLKANWPVWADELQALFDAARDKKEIDGKLLKLNNYTNWFNKLRTWATSNEEQLDIGAGWQRLSPEGLAAAWKTTPPAHPALTALPDIRPTLAALPEPRSALLAHAARWIATAFAGAQKRRSEIGFNDLLTGLEAALNGTQGERLAQTIRQQFPVALIDEFQDTDPVQYRIFERVYDIAGQHEDRALILIGDPKQAIYAFRGADIYTYLQARHAVAGRLHTLDTNRRSTAAMVAATNHCFRQVEAQADSAGAFLFRQGADNPVPFLPVRAQGQTEAFQVGGQIPPAMTLAVLDDAGALAKGAYTERLAEVCATQIVAWLNHPAAGFADPAGKFKPLQPGHLAVLVNKGDEAGSIRQALFRRGVRSVYLSDKDSVYATPQADEVYRWLAACADPDNERLLRAALSTPSLGLSFSELDALNLDEEAWEMRVVQFKGYRERWRTRGVLPMIRRLLLDFGGNQRLLELAADPLGQSGERILTDLLHLAELLQQASQTLEGEHALLRFLAEQIAAPEGEAEGRKLRLESDADLVQVVTIHKSKGLEYPLVFLPFIAATRLTKDTDRPLKWHDAAGELRISLEPSPEILAAAERDRLGEDLRKLYVALTRAKYHTWLGLAPLKNGEPSAIGHLFGLSEVDAGQYRAAVQVFAGGQPYLAIPEALAVDDARFVAKTAAAASGLARRPQRAAREPWWISSYSSLPVAGKTIPEAAVLDDDAASDRLLEDPPAGPAPMQTPPATSLRPLRGMHAFPKGADAGSFLHALLEWAAQTGFSASLADPAARREVIARRCQPRRWAGWIDCLDAWLQQLLTTPLPAAGNTIRLDALTTYQAEMEFWFAASAVDLRALDESICRHTLGSRPRPRLDAQSLNGLLKGFIDLVFEHEGRYYVADYKSNWLGPDDAAYTPEAMDEAIRAHRYDLQYALYLLALHRLLQSRLPDYDYDRHVGGAAYLFLRGLGASTVGVHFERPPKALIESLDALFAGRHSGGTPGQPPDNLPDSNYDFDPGHPGGAA